MKNKIEFEPYQPFFLSGLLISLMGVGLWLFFQMGWIAGYPLQAHSFLMVMGFLQAYISGFLMTAVPKMSQTQSAQKSEVGFGIFLLWLQVLFALSGQVVVSYGMGAIQLTFLLFFVGRRFVNRKANPPVGFVFLPFGLMAGMIGCAFLALPVGVLSSEWYQLAKNLVHQAFIMNLILGLGTRLIPALTRVQGALDVRATGKEKVSHFLAMALIFNSTFLVEAFLSPSAGMILRALVVACIAVQKFKILRPRQTQGHLGLGIRLSVYFLAAGFFFAGIFPAYSIHFLHLSYIGGFALLTFLISTRVVLAHGGYDLTLELENSNLIFFFGVAVLIALLRLILGFEGQGRSLIIWSLCLAWIGMLVIWSRDFMAKLFKAENIK